MADVVKRQLDLGLDIINEGEYGHITSGAVDYGAWWNYSFSRLGGLTMTDTDRWESAEVVRSKPGEPRLTSFIDRRDRALFSEAYNDPDSGIFTGRAKVANPEFTGPVTYIGQDEVAADVRLLADALPSGTPGFIAALSPGSAARLNNRYYDDEHQLLADVGRAMRTEYQAITDAGLTVQFDAPDLAEAWDQINPEPTVEDFRGFIRERIDVLNDSIAGLPKEQTRLHICWGSWHGPHVTDVPFADHRGNFASRGRRILFRSRVTASRARMARVAGPRAAGRHRDLPRRGFALHQRGRASAPRGRSHHPIRRGSRP